MRALTMDELEHVSGGEIVVVRGRRRDELTLLAWDQYFKQQEIFAGLVAEADFQTVGLDLDLNEFYDKLLSIQTIGQLIINYGMATQSLVTTTAANGTVTHSLTMGSNTFKVTDSPKNGIGTLDKVEVTGYRGSNAVWVPGSGFQPTGNSPR